MADAKKLTELQQSIIKTFYLFMIVDGDLSLSEQERFALICLQMGMNPTEADSFVQKFSAQCSLADAEGAEIHRQVYKALKKVISSQITPIPYKTRLQILWNLNVLAYADEVIAPQELQFIDYLQVEWQLDDQLAAEIADTVQTITMLEEKLDWLESTDMPAQEIEAEKRQIEADVEELKAGLDESIFD